MSEELLYKDLTYKVIGWVCKFTERSAMVIWKRFMKIL